jgi:hypothetical protein
MCSLHLCILKAPDLNTGCAIKTQLGNNHVLRYQNEFRKRFTPCSRLCLTPDTGVKVTLVARPMLTLVAQTVCRCEHGVFPGRTSVHSRSLFRIKVVCCCSWSIWHILTKKYERNVQNDNGISGHRKYSSKINCSSSNKIAESAAGAYLKQCVVGGAYRLCHRHSDDSGWEIPFNFNETTRRVVPEDGHLHTCHRQKLKSVSDNCPVHPSSRVLWACVRLARSNIC